MEGEVVNDESDDYPDDDEFEFDCRMTKGGQCMAAGSEDCDFECPYRHTIYAKFFGDGRRRRRKS